MYTLWWTDKKETNSCDMAKGDLSFCITELIKCVGREPGVYEITRDIDDVRVIRHES